MYKQLKIFEEEVRRQFYRGNLEAVRRSRQPLRKEPEAGTLSVAVAGPEQEILHSLSVSLSHNPSLSNAEVKRPLMSVENLGQYRLVPDVEYAADMKDSNTLLLV